MRRGGLQRLRGEATSPQSDDRQAGLLKKLMGAKKGFHEKGGCTPVGKFMGSLQLCS